MKILHIDDDLEDLEILADIIESKRPDVTVTSFQMCRNTSLMDTLREYESSEYDGIIVDFIMYPFYGVEVIKIISKSSRPHLTMLLTGLDPYMINVGEDHKLCDVVIDKNSPDLEQELLKFIEKCENITLAIKESTK